MTGRILFSTTAHCLALPATHTSLRILPRLKNALKTPGRLLETGNYAFSSVSAFLSSASSLLTCYLCQFLPNVPCWQLSTARDPPDSHRNHRIDPLCISALEPHLRCR